MGVIKTFMWELHLSESRLIDWILKYGDGPALSINDISKYFVWGKSGLVGLMQATQTDLTIKMRYQVSTNP